jgi:hypothetical protein
VTDLGKLLANDYLAVKANTHVSPPPLHEVLETLPEIPAEWQLKLLVDIISDVKKNQDIVDSSRFYLLQGAYGIGKTTFGAMLTLAHLYQFGYLDVERGYKGNIVSGSLTQLITVTCATLRDMLMRSAFKQFFTMTGNQLYINNNPNKFIRFCVCNNANIDSFAGIHKAGGYVFNYFDEGTAIHDKGFDIAETFMDKGNCTWLVTGNPTSTNGEFYRKSISPKWNVTKVTRYDFWGENDQWAADIKAEYGEDSDTYRMKVMAEFPQTSTANVFTLFACKEAERRGRIFAYSGLKEYAPSDCVLMVDPSQDKGECDHGICVRDHIAVRELIATQGDILSLAQQVVDLTEVYNIVAIHLDCICCGWGLDACILQQLSKKRKRIPIVGVNNAMRPSHNKYAANKRAENIIEAKKWLESFGGVCPSPNIKKFFDQLMQVMYKENALNIKLAEKEGVQDLVDAFFGTFENPQLLVNSAVRKHDTELQQIRHRQYKLDWVMK